MGIGKKKHRTQTHLDRNIEFGNIGQGPIDYALDIVFPNALGHSLHFKQFPVLVSDETILRKVPRKMLDNTFSQLFFLFGKIRACIKIK